MGPVEVLRDGDGTGYLLPGYPPGRDLGPVTGVSSEKDMGPVRSIMGWRWGYLLERTWDPQVLTDTCENSTFPPYYVRGRKKKGQEARNFKN